MAVCTASPHPGLSTTRVVSHASVISTSACPTPTVSMMMISTPDRVENAHRLGGCQRKTAEVPSRRHRTNEDFGVERVILHANAVAEQSPAGKGTRRIDRQHSDAAFVRPDTRHEALGERGLAGPGSAGDADRVSATRVGVELAHHLGEVLSSVLNERDKACDGAPLAMLGACD